MPTLTTPTYSREFAARLAQERAAAYMHAMGPWGNDSDGDAHSECRRCGAFAYIANNTTADSESEEYTVYGRATTEVCNPHQTEPASRENLLENAVRDAYRISEDARLWNRGTVERMREALKPAVETMAF